MPTIRGKKTSVKMPKGRKAPARRNAKQVATRKAATRREHPQRPTGRWDMVTRSKTFRWLPPLDYGVPWPILLGFAALQAAVNGFLLVRVASNTRLLDLTADVVLNYCK